MQIVRQFVATLVAALSMGGPALADIATSKGMASEQYESKTVTPETRAEGLRDAKLNALERYIAETNAAKQRLFDAARPQLLGSIDSFILSSTTLSETDDPQSHTYTVVVSVEINEGRFENALADQSGLSADRTAGAEVAVVFVSRAPASVQVFDPRVYQRHDVSETGSLEAKGVRATTESESIGGRAVGTGDVVREHGSDQSSNSTIDETGGSTTQKSAKVEWAVANSSDIDQEMSGAFADAGLSVVGAEFIDNLDLDLVRKDFGTGDDLLPATLRSIVAAVRAKGIRYVTLGTMDQGMADADPVSGNSRVFVTVNARMYDLSGTYPRVVAAVGPVQYAGLGPNAAVATTNGLKLASEDVASQLIAKIAVKGVR